MTQISKKKSMGQAMTLWMTHTNPQSSAKQLSNDTHIKCLLWCLGADERPSSRIFVYKNKHVPCFMLIIYSLKYMICY